MIRTRVEVIDGKVECRLNKSDTAKMQRGLDVMADLVALTNDKDTSQALALGALVVEKYGHQEMSDESTGT